LWIPILIDQTIHLLQRGPNVVPNAAAKGNSAGTCAEDFWHSA
jgi:hypothetical protein